VSKPAKPEIPEDLKKAWMARHLLEPPAAEVVGELIERISRLEAEKKQIARDVLHEALANEMLTDENRQLREQVADLEKTGRQAIDKLAAMLKVNDELEQKITTMRNDWNETIMRANELTLERLQGICPSCGATDKSDQGCVNAWHNQPAKPDIPEDLKVWYSVACDKVHFQTDYDAIKTLIERIARLEAELEEERAGAETPKALADAEDENRQLREQLAEAEVIRDAAVKRLSLVWDFQNKDYWCWGNDEHDHLESLVCPIVITADDLRSIVKRAEKAEATVARLSQPVSDEEWDGRHRFHQCEYLNRAGVDALLKWRKEQP
jgi:uncharacterized protein (UPF0335 family)